MGRLTQFECNPDDMSMLSLAFVGDCVFDLFVREELVCTSTKPVGELNKMKVARVCCQSQSEIAKRIEPVLDEKEADIFRRGRNAHVTHPPKSASIADYHAATALECLIGYLYLKGDIGRIRELFSVIDSI